MKQEIQSIALPPLFVDGTPRTLTDMTVKDMKNLVAKVTRISGGLPHHDSPFKSEEPVPWWPNTVRWNTDFLRTTNEADRRDLLLWLLQECYCYYDQADVLYLFDTQAGTLPNFRLLQNKDGSWNLLSAASNRLVWRIPSTHLAIPVHALYGSQMCNTDLESSDTYSKQRQIRDRKSVTPLGLSSALTTNHKPVRDRRVRSSAKLLRFHTEHESSCTFCQHVSTTLANHYEHEMSCSHKTVKFSKRVAKDDYLAMLGLMPKAKIRKLEVEPSALTLSTPDLRFYVPDIPFSSPIGRLMHNHDLYASDVKNDAMSLKDMLTNSGIDLRYPEQEHSDMFLPANNNRTATQTHYAGPTSSIKLSRSDFRYQYQQQRRREHTLQDQIKQCRPVRVRASTSHVGFSGSSFVRTEQRSLSFKSPLSECNQSKDTRKLNKQETKTNRKNERFSKSGRTRRSVRLL